VLLYGRTKLLPAAFTVLGIPATLDLLKPAA
jgi:hypothetical protein